MPRKKLLNPRENWTLRLSYAERERIDRAAAAAGLKPSDYARDVLLNGPQAAPAVPSLQVERHRLAATALAEQLRRIGINLNQLLQHVHQRPDERVPSDTPLIVGQIRTLVRQAREL